MDLIFSLFDIASAREVPWHTAVHPIHSLETYQCPSLCPIHLC